MIFLQYFLALLLTILLELLITWLFRLRNKKIILAVIAANLITHTSLHMLFLIISLWLSITLPLILLLELIVVLTEWKIIEGGMRCKSTLILLLSIVMNTTSYLVGVIIQL